MAVETLNQVNPGSLVSAGKSGDYVRVDDMESLLWCIQSLFDKMKVELNDYKSASWYDSGCSIFDDEIDWVSSGREC